MLSEKRDKQKLVLNWSSGKDAALAYHLLLGEGQYEVSHLLTTISADHGRVVMHGVREELLDAQAQRMNKELIKVRLPASPSDEVYKSAMETALAQLGSNGVSVAAFGDIFLEDLRNYREEQLAKANFSAVFPLWGSDTAELVRSVEDAGIEAIIVCVNEKFLSKDFLGRKIGRELLADLPANVDPCGENGEFHSFVYNAPFYCSPIHLQSGEIVYKVYESPGGGTEISGTGFYFLDC